MAYPPSSCYHSFPHHFIFFFPSIRPFSMNVFFQRFNSFSLLLLYSSSLVPRTLALYPLYLDHATFQNLTRCRQAILIIAMVTADYYNKNKPQLKITTLTATVTPGHYNKNKPQVKITTLTATVTPGYYDKIKS